MGAGRRVKVYEAKDGWRWQLWSSSDLVAESGEAYTDLDYCAEQAAANTPEGTPIEIVREP